MMKTRPYQSLLNRAVFVGVGCLFILITPAQAQYTADFQTNIISGVISNWSAGSYYVGNTNFADVLLIQSSGVLSDAQGYLGYDSSSSNNSVLVTGTGSIWNNLSLLYLGYSGAGNSLVISNGGKVLTYSGYLGYNSTSRDNSILVTDTGSVWSNGDFLYVGRLGANNSLVISNGGEVYSRYSYVGGNNTSSSNNSVLVTDPGSVWNTSAFELNVGSFGAGNSLVVSNGGKVASSSVKVTIGSGNSSSNNSVLVSGTGSVWSNSGSLYVGNFGASNSLVIGDGGRVVFTGTFGGGYGYVGYNSSSSNNSVLVRGAGSVWNNSGDLYIGYFGVGNSLLICDGGQVESTNGYVGWDTFKGGNSVQVTGPDSVWSNRNDLFVGRDIGNAGKANSLVISNGGKVFNNSAYVGYSFVSTNNTVRVMDGAVWQNNALRIGFQGKNNALFVNAGSVLATNVVVGFASTTCDNLIQLDSGSVIVTNATQDALFEVRKGKYIQNGGLLLVDQFIMTNACAQFVRTGGTLIYGIAVLDPNRDDDGDGLSNGYEQSHGLDPLNADADLDGDGDGMSNLQEYQAGTDPINSASVFRIVDIAALDDDMLLTWTTVGGKKYAVQTLTAVDGGYTNDFVEPWPVIIAPGTGESTLSVIDVDGATNVPGRFYRVRLVP